MATCTNLTTFHHICGHLAGSTTHIPTCPVESGPVAGHLNPTMTFHCRYLTTRYAYNQSQCPNCTSDLARGLPLLPGQLAALRMDYGVKVSEQDAQDAVMQLERDNARRAAEEAQRVADEARRTSERMREEWLADQERRWLVAESAGTPVEDQPLVFRPDTASSMLLERVVISTVAGGDGEGDGSAESENCGICLELMEGCDDIRQLPCKHPFHMECITPWLDSGNMTCPMCRHVYKITRIPYFGGEPGRPPPPPRRGRGERGGGLRDPDGEWLTRFMDMLSVPNDS
ncbi:hypothetical protein BKA65DRAFT_189621 [Rhexocercosporidium sp. MPI-PUGE-AT-0058]|nr:hypothetical protein BKA65DRAFT_189621 [Rhexocercosporidium sp. MPI-PUGE-AT-0058]